MIFFNLKKNSFILKNLIDINQSYQIVRNVIETRVSYVHPGLIPCL